MPDEKPDVVRISVTGHRSIDGNHELISSIQQVLAQIILNHPGANYQLFSALAEGSDQLVARIALQNELIRLIVPLPLPIESYLRDFETKEGKAILDHLLKSADLIINLAQAGDPDSAYDTLANYLVDACTVLIALWNGMYTGKKGGTSQVVKLALKAGKPVYWIYCNDMHVGAENTLQCQKQHAEIQQLRAS